MITEHHLISFDETPLFYRKITPPTPVKAVVFLIHGMGEHGGRYVALGRYLASCGFECWLPDLRGFGRSGGGRGFVRRFEDLQRDLENLYGLAERTHRGISLFILGHSFGGLVAVRTAQDRRLARLKGLILSSPLFGIAVSVPAWQSALAGIFSVIHPTLLQNNRVQADMLTHDTALRASHAEDKLIHFQISVRLYTEMRAAMKRALKKASAFQLPTLILQAGDDKIVSKKKTIDFYGQILSLDKELEIYEGFYHEILNETERQTAFTRIGHWILKRI